MRFFKSRFSCESGSAVAEFAALALPLCLMTISATNHGFTVYSDSMLRAGAIASARYASLADTSLADAQAFAANSCLSRWLAIDASCNVELVSGARQFALATFTYKPLGVLLYQPEMVTIRVSTALEVAKR